MNLPEAIAVFVASPSAESLALGQTKVLVDRVSGKIQSQLSIDQLTSNEWTLIFNQEM